MLHFPINEALDDSLPVTVVLRRWRGVPDTPIVALFPFVPWTLSQAGEQECTCYQHVGQHGGADYLHVIHNTDPVDLAASDAVALLEELKGRGYLVEAMTHEEACIEAGYCKAIKEIREG